MRHCLLFTFIASIAAGCAASSSTSSTAHVASPDAITAAGPGSARARFIAWSLPEPRVQPDRYALPCELRIEAVPGGIALRFSKGTQDLETLHERVQRFSKIYTVPIQSTATDRVVLVGQEPPRIDGDSVASHGLRQILDLDPVVWTQQYGDGAWIYLMAREPGEIESLRARVRWHAADLMPGLVNDENVCPAMPGVLEPAAPRETAAVAP